MGSVLNLIGEDDEPVGQEFMRRVMCQFKIPFGASRMVQDPQIGRAHV